MNSSPNPKLLVIGHVGYDIIFVDGVEKSRCIAGAAYYTSVGASCISNKVGIVARVNANDNDLCESILGLGLSTIGIFKTNSPSSQFKNYYLSKDMDSDAPSFKEDIFLGCANDLSFTDSPPEFLSASIVHISTAPPEHQAKWIRDTRSLTNNDCRLAIDTIEPLISFGKSQIIENFELCDIIFVNKREDELLNHYRHPGKIVIVKKGRDGAELWRGTNLELDIRPPIVSLIDSTGAGDVLAGVFLALCSEGSDYKAALEMAVKIASDSVTQYGVEHITKNKPIAPKAPLTSNN